MAAVALEPMLDVADLLLAIDGLARVRDDEAGRRGQTRSGEISTSGEARMSWP